MIHSYDSHYLDDAMKCLGEAMDYANNCCDIDLDIFIDLFITTGYAKLFEQGVPKIVSGLSGTELVALAASLSFIISKNTTSEETDLLGNFFSALGSNLSTIASEKSE